MNLIFRNYLRAIPLLVAGTTSVVGYIYTYLEPYRSYECDAFYGQMCAATLGHPAIQLSYWLIPIALLVMFSPRTFYKRWIRFAVIYFIAILYLVHVTRVTPYLGKETMATFFGIVMLTITIIWLLIHIFISSRKSKTAQIA